MNQNPFNQKKSGNKITFSPSITVIVVPAKAAVTKTVAELDVTWIDDGTSVAAMVDQMPLTRVNPVILWDSTTTPTYSQIANWTEDQAEARLKTVVEQ